MIGRCLPGMYGWTKGWVCRVAEKAVWAWILFLASHQGSVNGDEFFRLAKRMSSLMGKVTHLCRVYQIVAVTPCSGKGTANAAGKELHEVLVNL